MAGQIIPSGVADPNNLLVAKRSTQMQLILTAGDRLKYGFTTGLYEICIFGYKDASSVAITPTEVITSGQYVANDGVTYTVNIPSTKAI